MPNFPGASSTTLAPTCCSKRSSKGVAEPGRSLRIRKLVDEEPAAALVWIERIVLGRDDFRLAVAIEIGDRQRVRTVDAIDDMRDETPVPWITRVLEPGHASEVDLPGAPVAVFFGQDNVLLAVAIDVGDGDACDFCIALSQQVRGELAVAAVFQPVRPGDHVQPPVAVQVGATISSP